MKKMIKLTVTKIHGGDWVYAVTVHVPFSPSFVPSISNVLEKHLIGSHNKSI
jgi:hypothetical protein